MCICRSCIEIRPLHCTLRFTTTQPLHTRCWSLAHLVKHVGKRAEDAHVLRLRSYNIPKTRFTLDVVHLRSKAVLSPDGGAGSNINLCNVILACVDVGDWPKVSSNRVMRHKRFAPSTFLGGAISQIRALRKYPSESTPRAEEQLKRRSSRPCLVTGATN